MDSLGFELNASQRADIIPLGLGSYWKRAISGYEPERRNYYKVDNLKKKRYVA